MRAALTLFLMVAATPATAEAYHGNWALTLEDCRTSSPDFVAIDGRTVTSIDAICRINRATKAQNSGDTVFTLYLLCENSEDRWRDVFVIRMFRENLMRAKGQTWRRCFRAPSS